MESNQETTTTSSMNRPHRRRKAGMFICALIIVLLILGAIAIASRHLKSEKAQASTYQAVFLTNGQVYFGKLSEVHSSWIDLKDIYYLQVTQNLQAAATADQTKTATPATGTPAATTPNIQLVKLGSELHGPEDVMHIERDKILFWENMSDSSKVLAAIKKDKAK